MPVRTATINGRVYEIDVDMPFDGLCDHPFRANGKPAIRLSCNLRSQRGVQTLLHEIGHAENWNIPEAVIDRYAVDAGKLVWRLIKSGQLHGMDKR